MHFLLDTIILSISGKNFALGRGKSIELKINGFKPFTQLKICLRSLHSISPTCVYIFASGYVIRSAQNNYPYDI